MKIIAICLPISSVILLLVAYALSAWVKKAVKSNDMMQEIGDAIKLQVNVFRKKEFKMLLPLIFLSTLLVGLIVDWLTAAVFLLGMLLSFLASFLSVLAATGGNVRAAFLAKEGGLSRTMRLSFRSGAIIGLCTIGFCLLGSSVVFLALGVKTVFYIGGFGFGAALVSCFEQIGEGFFIKSLLEFQRKGSEVVTAAGLSADLFSSYAGAVIAAIVVSATAVQIMPAAGNAFLLDPMAGALFPLSLLTAGALGSILAVILVRGKGGDHATATLHIGIVFNAIVVLIAAFSLSWIFFQGINCALAVVLGLIFALTVGRIAEITSAMSSKQIKQIAEKSVSGAASVLMMGFSVAFLSSLWPVLCLVITIFAAKALAGIYGVALAAVGALSVTGMMLAAHSFGLVTENAGFVAKIVGISNDVKNTTDKLEATGRKTLMTGQGFSAAVTALTLIALFFAYTERAGLEVIDVLTSRAIIGLLIGSFLPFVFSSLLLNALAHKKALSDADKGGNDAGTEETLCQMEEAEMTVRKALAKAAMKDSFIAIAIGVAVPFAVGIFLGTSALGGLLLGTFCSGTLHVLANESAGNLFSTVRKYIEADHYGGKGSEAHKACIIGDTFGDPLKSLIGPSLNTLIRMIAFEAVLFAPLLSKIGGLL
ncbi:MAG: sodium/proton-translocating pyrophosphatase [Eubacteriales bacterium]|nr:sodium/proton-translocating pyrophosphatase [Eubacteriales bacterium]